MKFVKLLTLLLLSIAASVNASQPKVIGLISDCLSLKNLLAKPFAEDHSLGVEKASFQYRNLEQGFKGICSNAQFSLIESGLKSTQKNQRYVFVWSATLGAESSDLSVSNIQYSTNAPNNIQAWLQTNHSK